DALAFLDVLQLAAAKEHVDEHLVLVFEEPASLVDLHIDVMFAGFGTDADFLELLLVGFGLGSFARLLVPKLAIVHDFADWRPFVGGYLDQVELRLAGHFHRLRRRHHAQLLALGTNEPDGTYSDLLVNSLSAIVLMLRMAVGWGNAFISFYFWGTALPARQS